MGFGRGDGILLIPSFQNGMGHPRLDPHITIRKSLSGQGMFLRDAHHAQHTGWYADALHMHYKMPGAYSKKTERCYPI